MIFWKPKKAFEEVESGSKDYLENLKATQKLNDLQMNENKKLIEKKSLLSKETRILKKVIINTSHKFRSLSY